MEAHKHFTCIAYDNVDFLIPSQHIVSGIYTKTDVDAPKVVFNKETLPHVHMGDLLEEEFLCSADETYRVMLVMRMQDFAKDVREKIIKLTNTAFPASGNLAISMKGAISSKLLDVDSLHLMPQGIRRRMWECGVCAMGFSGQGRKLILISPDLMMRKFFSIGKIKLPEETGKEKRR